VDERDERKDDIIAGRNAVLELLKSGRDVDKLYVRRGEHTGSLQVIVATAVSRKIPVIEVDNAKLDRLAGGVNHQGVAASAAAVSYARLEDIFARAQSRKEKPFIAIADGIEDPRNLGALIRSAEGAGAHGVIIGKRHAVGLTGTVAKASAGAVEHIPIVKVTNIAQTIDELKERGVWIFAAEAGGTPYYEVDMRCAAAFVFGSEGEGVSQLVRRRSDFLVSIPMYGLVTSLNVSAAAAVILCEAARQNRCV
jgi:23S rRNA (guanosine2251-2'-O)-methyltransferase